MKKLILALLLLPLAGIAQEVAFTDDWESALAKAQAENKPLLIDFYTDWCGWCKVQDTATWGDPTVANFVNERMVAVKLDAEGEGGYVAIRFRPTAYPTVILFDPNSETPRMVRYEGYNADNEAYLQQMQRDLENGWNNLAYNPLSEAPEFPDFIKAAYSKERPARLSSDELNEWFAEHGNMTDEAAWAVVQRYYRAMDEALLNQAISKMEHYSTTYGPGAANSFGQGVLTTKIRSAETEEDLNKAIAWAEGVLDASGTNTDFYRVYWYGEKQMWGDYIQALERLASQGKVDANYLNGRLWVLVEKECEDKESCETAAEMMAAYVASDDADPNFVDTFAWLLYKAGKTDEAAEQARRAIALAGEMESSQELLDLIES